MKNFRLIASLALASAFCFGSAKADGVVVEYHFKTGWNGLPDKPFRDGWHVLSPSPKEFGANTGVMTFLAHWDSSKKCWGIKRDCRPPSWAIGQGVSYVGSVNVNPADIFVNVVK